MTVVKFPASASRRIAARRPRRSKNGTPEERAAKAAAASTHATVAGIHFDPAAWLEHCAAIGLKVLELQGWVVFGADDADWERALPLLSQFVGTPGAKDAVKAILRASEGRSAATG
jgi:hypothetical protein